MTITLGKVVVVVKSLCQAEADSVTVNLTSGCETDSYTDKAALKMTVTLPSDFGGDSDSQCCGNDS